LSKKTEQPAGEDILETLGIDQNSNAKSLWRRWVFWVGLACLTVIGLVFWSARDANVVVQYQTDEIMRGDLAVTVTATGNLEPTNQVEVGSELSGLVETVAVDYNDQVKIGQILAKLGITDTGHRLTTSDKALQGCKFWTDHHCNSHKF
jgi:HlyD family secretion protein